MKKKKRRKTKRATQHTRFAVYQLLVQRMQKMSMASPLHRAAIHTDPEAVHPDTFWKYMINELIRVSSLSVSDYFYSTDFMQHTDEFHYRDSGSPVVFLESERLVQSLLHAKFTDADFSRPDMRFGDTFSIALPAGVKAPDGTPVLPCIIRIQNCREDLKRAAIHYSKRYLGMPEDHEVRIANEPDTERPAITMHFMADRDSRSTTRLDFSHMGRLLNTLKDYEEFLDANWEDFAMSVPTTPDEDRRSFWSARLVAALFVYVRAFPSAVVDGCPQTMRIRDVKHLQAKPSTITMPMAADTLEADRDYRGTVTPHWRRWHFRTLRADRYQRDEHGQPRTILVKDSMVNMDKAKTVRTRRLTKQK